eukprot:TRINITY_DN336_c0_g1_i1.p1 TRINITY_DN336_c0_g1~~TRINITY_DN336_c0_g1_i1.p1  ORF type:complete len:331 (-),score=77.32 TRINITY_DN336_c0_g1_i1:16-1008(-)
MGNTEGRTVKRKNDYNNYTIMLVGKMGAGKSSLGNFLLKREHFHAADDLGRVTDKNMSESTSLPGGITLKVIDTPGFGDFRESAEVKKDLADAFYEAKDGVDAFIFVISAAERIGREMVNHFEMFQQFIDHEHFFDYVIPVFTKVDQKLQKKGERDIHSYEKQERLIHSELENEQLKIFTDSIIKRSKQKWMCISNGCKDQFYYEIITRRLLQTIEGIRIERHGMVCTSNIMNKAKDLSEFEKEKNRKAEEEEIKRFVVGLLIHILINGMQQEEFNEMFGDDQERQRKNKEKEKEKEMSKEGTNASKGPVKPVTPGAATGNAKDVIIRLK